MASSLSRKRLCLVLSAAVLLVSSAVLAWPRRPAPAGHCPSATIRVSKKHNTVALICGGKPARTFPATFGANPVGPKEREGDERTPEGTYQVTSKVVTARFHRFLGLSYPNDQDRKRAASNGVTRLGGGIGIHGVRSNLSALANAWIRVASSTGLGQVWGPTDGCIGLTNADVEVLFNAVPVGTDVVITAD